MRRLFLLLLTLPLLALGQDATKHHFIIPKAATVNLSEPTEDWEIDLQHLEAPTPGISGLRAELHQKKLQIMQQYPVENSASDRAAAANPPMLLQSFEGNSFQGIPNDNDMAISNDSMVMSVTNRKLEIYNGVTGEELVTRSLVNLAQPLGVSGSKYDPKVIFDPNNNRFVTVFLSGFTWQTSHIIIGFSKTNDPTGEWNLYALPGNPLENETWSDYPVIGISGKDLFIGINTFTNGSSNNSGFTESCLWQIGLREGYVGFELVTNYYSNILPQSKKIFNITPISPAAESEMEDMYLLSNRNTDMENDSVFILHVTGRVVDPNTQLEVTTIHADQPYILPVPADQEGNQWFDTNDSRVLGGYLLNGRIYFVQSCTDPQTGTSAIYHGVINGLNGTPSMVSRIYSDPDLYYGYPNISWSGQNVNDEQSIITFNHTSETVPSGFSAIYVDASLQPSDRLEIKAGNSWVNVLSDTLERWGDYSGSQRLYDEPGKVWAVGSFGTTQHQHGTWIAELGSPNVTGVREISASGIQTNVYPNPFTERIEVVFDIEESMMLRLELIDALGRPVKLFVEDKIKAGKNRLSFNANFIPTGTYFLNAYTQDGLLFSKQVIKH